MADNTPLTPTTLNNLQPIAESPSQQKEQRLRKAMETRQPVRFTTQEVEGRKTLVQTESDPVASTLRLFETTGAENPNTALHLINQLRAILPSKLDIQSLNAASDLMNSIRPQDPMEGMLSAQLVACHTMAMSFAQKAMEMNQPDKAVESHLNRSTKLMRLFSQHMETLHKLRNKGQQTIQVQHIHLDGVHQAIVGNNVGIPSPKS